MARVEAFYFENGPESGEAIFEAFASKHAALFEENCDALQSENKLEYTAVYNEFCQVFEAHIESKTPINAHSCRNHSTVWCIGGSFLQCVERNAGVEQRD